MTKHSKNNTASSIFSYAEYKKLDYGTKRQRLGTESMRPFDACALCLQHARDPVACGDGHLFCRECVYADLLAQRKEVKRMKERVEALRVQEEEEKEKAREEARQRVLRDFERGQLGLAISISGSGKAGSDRDSGEHRGTKRKFAFDAEAAESVARAAEEEAMRQIEREQAEARKAALPDFWLPSLTPTAAPTTAGKEKAMVVCRAAAPAHSLSLKTLIPVSFTTLDRGKDGENGNGHGNGADKICPSCKKALSNNLVLFLMKPCAHVLCKTCTDTLVRRKAGARPGSKADSGEDAKGSKGGEDTEWMQCVVCDHVLKKGDVIELRREGTGFAGGGAAETSKKGVAFQG